MTTGYTAAIANDITFNDFAMRCARAMGALVMMRDEPFDAPIPERFEPSDYHIKKIADASARLLELQAMSEIEAIASAQAAFAEETGARNSAIQEKDDLRKKYTLENPQGCRICCHKRLTPSKHNRNCVIAKWWCGLHKKLIGEGHDSDLKVANGCDKWEKRIETSANSNNYSRINGWS
jgi:hypothetical protein